MTQTTVAKKISLSAALLDLILAPSRELRLITQMKNKGWPARLKSVAVIKKPTESKAQITTRLNAASDQS